MAEEKGQERDSKKHTGGGRDGRGRRDYIFREACVGQGKKGIAGRVSMHLWGRGRKTRGEEQNVTPKKKVREK